MPTGSLKLHLIYCNLIFTAQTWVILYLHISHITVLFPLCKLSDSNVMDMMSVILSILPVNQWVILAAIVLYLEHPNAGNIPLEVELDQCCRWRGLSRHHPFIHPSFHITCHVAPIGSASGRGNIWWSWIGLLDVIGVVGDVGEFYNNQFYCLVSFTSRVGGDAGKGASIFHSTDEDVQSPIGVDQCSGGVRY